jgi:hypothetical protein
MRSGTPSNDSTELVFGRSIHKKVVDDDGVAADESVFWERDFPLLRT